MKVKEYMIKKAIEIANDNSYGYSNKWPNNKFGEGSDPKNGDCGAFCSYCLNQALAQIGINTNEYYEPQGGTAIYNEAYLLKYCDRYAYDDERNQPGDILISGGHTVMVTAVDPDYITHASNDYDGVSGDSSGKEICTIRLYNGGWRYIYRLKDQYNKDIDAADSDDDTTYEMTYQEKRICEAAVKDISISKGSNLKDFVIFIQEYLNWYGYYDGTIDGDFGWVTFNAVCAWQKAKGLYVDGVIGPNSWAVIRKG